MSVNSPSPGPRLGDPPPKPLSEEEADLKKVELLFDARPADTHENRSWLEAALEGLSKALRDAAAWVAQVFSFMDPHGDNAVQVGSISRPRNVKSGSIPEELREANKELLDKMKSADEKQKFVESADMPHEVDTPVPDPDREAFNAYMSLCKRDKGRSGSVDCPQNFREGAERHALEFLKQVNERKKNAEDSGKDFWLNTEDQQKFKTAALLLRQERSKELKELFGDDLLKVPIQTNSNQQLQSFTAWMEWSKNPDSLPEDPDFSLDAAVAYAWELSAKHAGKAEATDPAMKKQLSSAAELISREAHYRSEYEAERLLRRALTNLDELKQPTTRPVDPQPVPAMDDELADPGLPPAPPPPRVPKRIQTPSATPEATTGAPPAPPPRVTRAQTQLPAAWRNIPELSALDDDRQVEATVLLNQFFQHYARQLDQPVPNFDAEPQYFSELAAVAALDFMKRTVPADGPVDPTIFTSRAAATHILREYERRKNTAPKSPG